MLYLNNIAIPVEESFSVRLEWVNPVCYFDQIPGNAGLGIEIPVNEITRAIFGNPERYEKYSNASDRKFPGFSIRKRGVMLDAGSLVITIANSETYSAWLQPNVGVMGEAQKDKFITELDWKKDVEFSQKATYSHETDDYCIVKLKNPYFWEDKGAHGNLLVPFENEDGEPDIREEYTNYLEDDFRENYEYDVNPSDGAGPVDNHARVQSPFLFFRYSLKEMLRMNGFFIRSHPFDDIPGANKLVVYNNYNIFSPTPETAEKTFLIFEEKLNKYLPVLREQIINLEWNTEQFNYSFLIPKISMKDALLGVQNWMNIVFNFRPDHTVDIVDREAIFDTSAFDLTKYQVSEWRKLEKKKVSLKFTAEYDKNDANFGDEFHDLTDRYNDFKEAVDTYSDLWDITAPLNAFGDRTIGQLRYVRDENKIYEYKWHVLSVPDANGTEEQFNILGWELVSSGPQYYVYRNGDEIEEIKTCISTLQMENGGLEVKQKGNIKTMRSLWSDFTFRMFYYINNDSGSTEYNNDWPPISLNWEGQYGLFNQRWKKTARWWANRQPLEAEFNLPLNVLLFVKTNMVKQKFRTEKGEFIIDTINVDAGVDDMGLATLKVYKA